MNANDCPRLMDHTVPRPGLTLDEQATAWLASHDLIVCPGCGYPRILRRKRTDGQIPQKTYRS